MHRKSAWLVSGLVLILGPAPPVRAQEDLTPGLVLMSTSSIEPVLWSGSATVGIFDTGSDEILDLKLLLRGRPLETITGNPSVYWPADTLIDLQQGVDFPSGPPARRSVATVVQAVSLEGVRPVTVTYGGTNPELWDVRVCLSAVPDPKPQGILTLTNDCGTAGTFVHVLTFVPKAIFTRQRDGREVIVDQNTTPSSGGITVVGRGFRTRRDAATGDYASAPAGGIVDADCNGTYANDETLPGTSNVLLGVARVNCNAANPAFGYEAVEPTFYELRNSLVLEPATQDDRILLQIENNQSALPPDANPLAAGSLGTLALLGVAAVVVRPGGRS